MSQTDSPAIEISQLNKFFGHAKKRKQVIHNFSLRVNAGDVYGFIGPNGAGKSTVIKLLLQFYQPDSGNIRIFENSTKQYEFRHKIGYLAEVPFFYEHLTAWESLTFAGTLQGMNPELIKKQIPILLDKINLTNANKQQVRSFSKGMKQRLGFAAAMIHDPPLYIFDEPMSGLDPLGRNLVKSIFRDLAIRNKTIFFSTHILSDIEELCDRITLIHHGHTLYEGTVDYFKNIEQSLDEVFVSKINEWNMANDKNK